MVTGYSLKVMLFASVFVFRRDVNCHYRVTRIRKWYPGECQQVSHCRLPTIFEQWIRTNLNRSLVRRELPCYASGELHMLMSARERACK